MSLVDATQNRSPQPSGADEALDQARTDSLANKEAFLQMLIAQIQNQDPLNPTDGVEFLTQLSQFSQLEQTIGIRGDLRAIRAALANAQVQSSETE